MMYVKASAPIELGQTYLYQKTIGKCRLLEINYNTESLIWTDRKKYRINQTKHYYESTRAIQDHCRNQ